MFMCCDTEWVAFGVRVFSFIVINVELDGGRPPPFSLQCVFVCVHREIRKEQLRARLALLPLLQAEHDRRCVSTHTLVSSGIILAN